MIEHGKGIETLADVIWWENPRSEKRVRNKVTGKWEIIKTKAMRGEVLYKILCTLHKKYGCDFLFCDKAQTGKRIIEILGSKHE